MSRSGYSDDHDDSDYPLALYRGTVQSSIRGKRGQALLRELAAAMDAMPSKRLIAEELVQDGDMCALGVVGRARGIDVEALDPDDIERVASTLDVADCLAREVVWWNDDGGHRVWVTGWHGQEWSRPEYPEERWARMRKWVDAHLLKTTNT